MENIQPDILSDDLIKPIRRKELLPWWIKVFMWIFIVFGALTIPSFIVALLGYRFSVSLYGLATNSMNSWPGFCLLSLFLLKGLVAYGLLKERFWATMLAIIDAVAGIIICLVVMIFSLASGFRLELIFLLPYLIKMIKINSLWQNGVDA